MAKNQQRRLTPSDLAKDEEAFHALQKITGYTTNNPAYALEAIVQAVTEMRAKQAAEDQVRAMLATAHDEAITQEWVVHNLMLGSKNQVKGQFGRDSVQIQEIGLKRASDYKTQKPRNKSISK